jgi:hypothetical protein
MRIPGSTESRLTRQAGEQTIQPDSRHLRIDFGKFAGVFFYQMVYCITRACPCINGEIRSKSANSRSGQGDMLVGVESS